MTREHFTESLLFTFEYFCNTSCDACYWTHWCILNRMCLIELNIYYGTDKYIIEAHDALRFIHRPFCYCAIVVLKNCKCMQ